MASHLSAVLRPVTRRSSTLLQVARPSIANRSTLRLFSRAQISSSNKNNGSDNQLGRDLEVGELEGAKFRVEPLRRTGEDPATMRARLLCALPAYLPIDLAQIFLPSCVLTNWKINPASEEP